MNKRVIVLWSIIVVGLFLTILVIGITNKEELKYIKLKNEVKEVTKEYIKDNNIDKYPVTISSEILEEKDYIDELILDNKVCACDIVVNKKLIFYTYNIKFTCINKEM